MKKSNLIHQPGFVYAIMLEKVKNDIEGDVRLIVFAADSMDGDRPGALSIDNIVQGSMTEVALWWVVEGDEMYYRDSVYVHIHEDGVTRWEKPDQITVWEAAEAAMSWRKDLFDL